MFSRFLQLAALSTLAASAAFAPAAGQVTFLDHRGKAVELDSPPKRLVSIVPVAPILYYSVDQTAEHMAGVSEASQRMFKDGVYGDVIPPFMNLKTYTVGEGFVPNVEALLALNPDLVVQWTFDPKIIEPLERVGLKVMGWDCCTEAQRRDYLTMSGYASGHIDRAQKLLQLQDDSNAAQKKLFADTQPADYVSMLEVDLLGDQIRVIANSSQDYGLSGVRNLSADDSGEWWRTIDVEQFLVWNPKIIIIPAWDDSDTKNLQPADFYANPLLASVDAVKNKRVYKVPEFNRSPDAPEVFLTAQWLARIAHPEKFDAAAASFRQTVRDTYKTVYGAELTDAQVDRVLKIESNHGSAIYAEAFD
jgi:iron complex transport system substrate-binding protein